MNHVERLRAMYGASKCETHAAQRPQRSAWNYQKQPPEKHKPPGTQS